MWGGLSAVVRLQIQALPGNTLTDTPSMPSKCPGACRPAKLKCEIKHLPRWRQPGLSEWWGLGQLVRLPPSRPGEQDLPDHWLLPAERQALALHRAPPVTTRILPSVVPVSRPSASFGNFPQKFASKKPQLKSVLTSL
ncbi:unnamed protein product [Rangifer tarandus platyrhynchus]|uniref:Uncharacterized protein n=1 Tax=Rangifer tarandus platyrhynchus TaxID=3082113 RepID=A0AC59YSK2_RANTA